MENSTDVPLQKSPTKENTEAILPLINQRTKDYRFWIALGVIIFLLLAIIIKLQLQIEDRYGLFYSLTLDLMNRWQNSL